MADISIGTCRETQKWSAFAERRADISFVITKLYCKLAEIINRGVDKIIAMAMLNSKCLGLFL